MSLAPNQFSDRHGPGVKLKENFTTVSAIAIENAVAYTSLPIPLGRLYQLKVLKPGIIVSYSLSTPKLISRVH